MAKILKSALIGTLTFSDHRSFEFPGEEAEITVAGGHAVSIHKSSFWRILAAGKPADWYDSVIARPMPDSRPDEFDTVARILLPE